MKISEENFGRLGILTTTEGTEAMRKVFKYHVQQNNYTIETFLDTHKHHIYHYYKQKKCCQCEIHGRPHKSKPVLYKDQMQNLFDCSMRIQGHDPSNDDSSNDDLMFCCRKILSEVPLNEFDITLLYFFLKKFCSSTCTGELHNAFEQIKYIRDMVLAHVSRAEMEDGPFKKYFDECHTHILTIYQECGEDTAVYEEEFRRIKSLKYTTELHQEILTKLLQELKYCKEILETLDTKVDSVMEVQAEHTKKLDVNNKKLDALLSHVGKMKIEDDADENEQLTIDASPYDSTPDNAEENPQLPSSASGDTSGFKWDCVILHAEADEELARSCYRFLNEVGVIDLHGDIIPYGTYELAGISDLLSYSRLVLLLHTKHFNADGKMEYGKYTTLTQALSHDDPDKRGRIIPILGDEQKISKDLCAFWCVKYEENDRFKDRMRRLFEDWRGKLK